MLGILWRSLLQKSQSAVKSGNMSCDCSDACTTVDVCSSSSCVVADVYLLLLRAWLPKPCHSCTWCLFITLMRGNAYCVVTLDRAVHFLRSLNISVRVSARRCSWEGCIVARPQTVSKRWTWSAGGSPLCRSLCENSFLLHSYKLN